MCFSALLVTLIAGTADDKHPTEAPTGFNTPSFDIQNSVSNGIPEPAGSFALNQQRFENRNDFAAGLGPVYNPTSCVD